MSLVSNILYQVSQLHYWHFYGIAQHFALCACGATEWNDSKHEQKGQQSLANMCFLKKKANHHSEITEECEAEAELPTEGKEQGQQKVTEINSSSEDKEPTADIHAEEPTADIMLKLEVKGLQQVSLT